MSFDPNAAQARTAAAHGVGWGSRMRAFLGIIGFTQPAPAACTVVASASVGTEVFASASQGVTVATSAELGTTVVAWADSVSDVT